MRPMTEVRIQNRTLSTGNMPKVILNTLIWCQYEYPAHMIHGENTMRARMWKIIGISPVICACAAGLVLFVAVGGCTNRTDLAENEALKAENARLTRELAIQIARNEDLIRSQPGLRAEERDVFRRRGLTNPDRDIIADLEGREDLMPIKGIFGARPSFYKDVRMYLIITPRVHVHVGTPTERQVGLRHLRHRRPDRTAAL